MKKRVFALIGVILLICTVFLCSCSATGKSEKISSIEDLENKKVGVLTGSVFDMVAKKYIPNCDVEYLNSNVDTALALEKGKISAYVMDKPFAELLINKYPNHKILQLLSEEHYGYIFNKDSQKAQKLREQMNLYIEKLKSDGSLERLKEKWFGTDEDIKTVDTESLTGENGTIAFSITSDVGMPFVYVKDGKYVGFDIDMTVGFCKEYGYGIEISDSNASGMLIAVSTGKADFGASCVTITEERKESMLFSEPYYTGGSTLVVKDFDVQEEKLSFIGEIAKSFKKTFIEESRWKIFAFGILTTLGISLLSLLLGTLIGFLLYLIYRCGNKVYVWIMDRIMSFMKKMPPVIILMVFYYVVFGDSGVPGFWVSVIVFTGLFAFELIGLFKNGVNTVDIGQGEAALALGYTKTQTFLKIIFPQALRYVIPEYRGAAVSLVRDTTIVGYIAVQDLTKVTDIIRGRTYEAIFPLLVTAIVYYLIATFTIRILVRINNSVDNKKRSEDAILKGVKRND